MPVRRPITVLSFGFASGSALIEQTLLVVSSLGRFVVSAGELLMRIAKRALGEDGCAAGRLMSKWRNRIVETLMRGASWQMICQAQRLTKRASMSRSLRAASEA